MIVTAERMPRLQDDFLNNIDKVCPVAAVEVRNLEENFFVLLQEFQEFVFPSSHEHRHQSLRSRIDLRIIL